jgi:hypothetical protein
MSYARNSGKKTLRRCALRKVLVPPAVFVAGSPLIRGRVGRERAQRTRKSCARFLRTLRSLAAISPAVASAASMLPHVTKCCCKFYQASIRFYALSIPFLTHFYAIPI